MPESLNNRRLASYASGALDESSARLIALLQLSFLETCVSEFQVADG